MGKKLTRKEKIALQKTAPKETSSKNNFEKKNSGQLHTLLAIVAAGIAFVLYLNTLGHGFALDDYSIILENTMTRKGTSALSEIFSSSYRSGYFTMDNDLYRPLSKAMFALEWQWSPTKPFLGHFINVLFYALTGIVLYFSLELYFKNSLLSLLTAALFIAHPIHTEVVANIKSRDELMCFFFFALTLYTLYHYLNTQKVYWVLLTCASFFLALLSKESAVTFLAVIPLFLYFFTNENKTTIAKSSFIILLPVALFMAIRYAVLGNVETTVSVADNLLSGQPFATRFPTAVYLMGLYLFKLILPIKLVSDYSFRELEVIGFTDWKFLVSFIIYIGLAVFAIAKFKQKNIFSFSILYFFITASVASNILILIGTSFGERLMYSPSFGFSLAMAAAINKISENKFSSESLSDLFKQHRNAILIAGAVIVLYALKTIDRNADWKNNYTLYTKDVTLSPNSSRTHYYLGNHITQDEFLDTVKNENRKNQYIQQAINELKKSISLYDQFADAHQQLARTYLRIKDYNNATLYFKNALNINPTNPLYYNNYGNVLYNTGDILGARAAFEKAVQLNPQYAHAYNNLGSIHGTLGEAAEKQNNSEEAKKNFEIAVQYFKKAIDSDPEYSNSYYFLGLTYRKLGDNQQADYYISQSEQIKARLNKK